MNEKETFFFCVVVIISFCLAIWSGYRDWRRRKDLRPYIEDYEDEYKKSKTVKDLNDLKTKILHNKLFYKQIYENTYAPTANPLSNRVSRLINKIEIVYDFITKSMS